MKKHIQRVVSIFLTIGFLIFAGSCSTERKYFKAQAPDGAYLFEAETFRLVDSDIVDDPAASDGKAVRIMTTRAFCSIDIQLPPGTYVARARAQAADEGHDEFYLSVGQAVMKVAPAGFARYDFCPQVLEFTVTAPGKDFLQVAAFSVLAPRGETGMIVDLLEVWEKARWEEREGNHPSTRRREDDVSNKQMTASLRAGS